MRPPRPMPEGARERLALLMKEAKSKGEYQRVQCVWLRAALGMTAPAVAVALGWNPGTVRVFQARYFKEGESIFGGVGQGGRHRQNLSLEQEDALLEAFLGEAERGEILQVSDVKARYQEAVGHEVPKSTVYRLLARHGWRKVAPRPRHPKADVAKQEEFKKNSQRSSRRKGSGVASRKDGSA